MNEMNLAIALLTTRLLAGVVFTFQGYDKLFRVGIAELTITMRAALGERHLPEGLIKLVALFTSVIEFACGLLLILGLFTQWALYLLCADLVIVSIGFSLAKPMWESQHVLFRWALILILLLLPPSNVCTSLDALLQL